MIPWVSVHEIRDQKYLKAENKYDFAPQIAQHPSLHAIILIIIDQIRDMIAS